jgi:hypothetical protein
MANPPKTNSAGLITPSQQKAALDAAKKPSTTTTYNIPNVIAKPTTTPAFNQTLNLYGAPSSSSTSSSSSSANKGGSSSTKATTNSAVAADLLAKQQALVESWGYNIDPNTGLYGIDPATGGPTGSQTSGGGSTQPSSNTPAPTAKPTPNVAYDTIAKILESYNITGLASVLDSIRKDYPEASSDDLLTLLQFDSRYNAKFNERFSANATRQKAGMSVLSPADYLAMEQGYKKTLDAYGLTTFQNQTYYDKFIANDLAVTEVSDRISLAYDRVMNDTNINKAFKDFYPSLTTTDIVSGILDPTNQFPALERKVKAAEIGGAALRQGLSASELSTTAEASKGYTNVTTSTLGADVLGQQGVTKAAAEAGYANIAAELPTAEKLSSIYGNQTEQYGRLQAEQAQFQGLASAKRAKQNLINLELGTFGGSSGKALSKNTSLGQI